MQYRIGIDCGGTFTDLVAIDELGRVKIEKTSSTPQDPSIAIINGLNKLGISLADTDYFVHGSTVGINTVIQNKGAKTAIITTKGFRDILELRRGRRVLDNLDDMYNLQQDLPQDYVGGYSPLVERTGRFEIEERVDYQGRELIPLNEEEVYQVARQLKAEGFEAIAVCYYFAFVNPAHEKRTAEILKEVLPDIPISISSDILPIIREYERTSTTMINAYIMPTVETYLKNLGGKLKDMGFKHGFFMMQSGGGILSAQMAASRPVYTIDSGPAAGVAASSELGRTMDCKNVIAFDMGGTTAKVCVINNNKPEITNNFWIDGKYFIGAPVMDMAEIGAGGGSMAWIDKAGAVHVGPQSAGADPGPVCYNRGGENPTVTDADLVLGYINKDYFLGGEMEVDVETSRQAIKNKIANPLGMSVEEAACGIYRMINANMLGALRIVTVQRGHDPRDFSLMVSGGTAAIHAARMAQDLRIPRVICPLIPGVFSAYGLITADAAYDVFRSYVARSTNADPALIHTIYSELKAEGLKRVAEMGFAPENITYIYKLDLRYVGQAHEVSIELPANIVEREDDMVDLQAIEAIFHARHHELFGYAQTEAPVELITLGLTAACPNQNRKMFAMEPGGKDSSAALKAMRPVYFEEYCDYKECPTYDREKLRPGNELQGPAIVEQKDTTIVVPPNTWAWVDTYGNLIIEIKSVDNETAKTGKCSVATDIFALGVLNSLLVAIPTEMAEVLQRTSYHPIFNEVLDFSTAMMDANGNLLATSSGVAMHLGALEMSTKAVINHFGKQNINPGDILIHNNPYPGGTHLPDIDIIMPVFYDDEIIAFSVSRGHHGDIGGANAGSFAGNSTSIFQEGIRIPATKLYDQGKLKQAWLELLLANVRVPNFTWGDLQAQISAIRIGAQRMQEMYAKYGKKQMQDVQDWLMDYSERRMRDEIEAIPDGEYVFEDYLDNDGVDKDIPVKIHVKVIVEGSEITFDFSGSNKQVRGPANSALGSLSSATYGSLFGITSPDIPKNHGCYQPIKIIAPEGLVVNAKFPAPLVSGNTETAIRVMDTINGAMARVLPDRVIAADSGTATAHIAGGFDSRNQEFYAFYLGSDACAFGARAAKDGFTCAGGPRTGGHVSQIPMEVFETRYPFIVDEYAFVADSGGPGRMRGGVSGVMRIRPVGDDCEIGGCNDRAEIAPYGIFGGFPGLHGSNKVFHHDGTVSDISRAGGIIAKPGETIIFRAPGGGGYGNPLDRDLKYLQHDVDNGYVSHEAAERDYGAVLDENGKIDIAATEKRRAELRQEWQREEVFIDQITKPYTLKSFRLLKMDADLS